MGVLRVWARHLSRARRAPFEKALPRESCESLNHESGDLPALRKVFPSRACERGTGVVMSAMADASRAPTRGTSSPPTHAIENPSPPPLAGGVLFCPGEAGWRGDMA